MVLAQSVAGIGLQTAGVKRPLHVARYAVEKEVAGRVGFEMHLAEAAIAGDLQVQVTHRLLIRYHRVVVLFVLSLIELGRIERPRQPLASSGGSPRRQP